MLASSQAFGGVIVQNTGGPSFGIDIAFLGQSFTTPSGGPWDDVTFNFYSDLPPTTPTAAGTAFLLSKEYLGTPSNLSSSTPGFLGESTGITGGRYVFPAALELQPGNQYFVYGNRALPEHTGGNSISGGMEYITRLPWVNWVSADGLSANFTLSGDVVSGVPEPSPLMVSVTALLGFGLLQRYRANG
jgi:hypothetical protein